MDHSKLLQTDEAMIGKFLREYDQYSKNIEARTKTTLHRYLDIDKSHDNREH